MRFRLFKGKPSDTYVLIAIDAVVVAALLVMCTPVKAQEDPRKEWVRLSYTEICATIKEVPPAPPGFMQLARQNPMWAALAAYLGEITEAREARKCNDT